MRSRLLSLSLAALLSLYGTAPLAAAPPNSDSQIGVIARISKIVRNITHAFLPTPTDELIIPHP